MPMIHDYTFLPFPRDVELSLASARTEHAPMHSLHEAYAVILEEVRELEGLVFSKDPDALAVNRELRHVAAMCQRAHEDVIEGEDVL